MQKLYDEAEVDAALCLWEECINRQWRGDNRLFDWLRGGEGVASARDMCILWGPDLEVCWKIAHEHFGFDDSFDWEFVPRWASLAMELTEEHHITPVWLKWMAYKVTEDWRERFGGP